MNRFAFLLAIVFVVDFPSAAHAYIDPGIGALLLQGLLAGIASAMIFFRNLRARVFKFLGLEKKKPENESEPAKEND